MSRDFIGSKISIITKSQCRYSGTIIGIDAQTSSIVLGNAKCFGTENRPGHSTNGHKAGTLLPITQFANSDIEDLKIVDEEQIPETPKQQTYQMPVVPSPPSIHDDPAIVSAVISSANKDNTSNSSISNRLMHNLQHMTLSDEKSKKEESRIRSNSSELGPSWSLISPSKFEHNTNNTNNNLKSSSQHQPGNKSKFFDDFISDKNNNNQNQSNRSYQRSSNTHSTQTSRENGGQYDNNGLPIRQPFFSNDRPYPQRQQQQQQNRYQNDSIQQQQNHYQNDNTQQQNRYQYDSTQQQQNRYQNDNAQYQQRNFYNNRRPQMFNQQRRTGGGGGGGGNRETFQDNPNDYEADFDFETSNLKFNKLTNEDDSAPNQSHQPHIDTDLSTEYSALYDKKKSFFDNLAITEPSDAPTSYMHNRSKNRDTFGNDGYQRYNDRSNGNGYQRYTDRSNGNGYQRYNDRSNGNGYRRSNNNYRQQQYGNEDFHYRQHNNNNNNNNGYHYRY